MPNEKKCRSCGVPKPLDAFHKKGEGRVHSSCKPCRNEEAKTERPSRSREAQEKREADLDGQIFQAVRLGGEALASFGDQWERVCVERLLQLGSIIAAAEALTMPARELRARLVELQRKAAARGWSPGHDMTQTVPDGFGVKRVSTYYSVDPVTGEKKATGQWVISNRAEDSKAAALLDALTHIADTFKGVADPVPAPVTNATDLLCVYPEGDPHFGMFSWAAETGANFDLKIAERLQCEATDKLVALAPASVRALLVPVGDIFHADSRGNATTSGTPVDVDGRWPKILAVVIRSYRYKIDRLLEKHTYVDVHIAGGNHDAHMSVVLATALAQFYEREPRVHVHIVPGKFFYYRFGKNLIAVTHGDTVKLAELNAIMACDRPTDWAETEHRYWLTGHIHHDTLKELPGCVVESFRTLASSDAWHRGKGYRSGRDAKLLIFDRTHGQIQRHTVGISQLAAQ